jgi:Rps23 Pro-64 3,4-dihydroxylase Tpa1-like proline 4-hydroxylase
MITTHNNAIDNCDEIIKKSEAFYSSRVEAEVRVCQGTVLTEEHLKDEQLRNLYDTMEALGQRYAEENNLGTVRMEDIQIIHYNQGEGFFGKHSDGGRSMNRAASGICYLNDVEKGGETIFYTEMPQIIQPRAGKMIFFSADQLHEATIPESGDKHIAVTWFQFT